jgi:hypothetical protein
MTYADPNRISSPVERSRSARATSDQTMVECDAPTDDEWRRAVAVIAEELLLRMAGYSDKEELAKEGCFTSKPLMADGQTRG